MKNEGKYALITGATVGIGYELAKLFAQDGYNIIAVARTEADLNRAANEFRTQYGVQVEVITKDLFGETAAKELYEDVKGRGLEVEILVNDAGQSVYGLFVETDIDRQLEIIHLNINTLTVLTYSFLKDMVARNSGKILQLGSVVSEVLAPYRQFMAVQKLTCFIY
jgi:short-subunit dehydrogenase